MFRHMLGVVAIAACFGLTKAGAQERHLSISAGALAFDVSGTGSASTLAARGVLPLKRALSLEAGVGATALSESALASSTKLLFADVLARIAPTRPLRARPFIAAGPSAAVYTNNGFSRPNPSLGFATAVGLEVRATSRTHVVVDARFRGWELNQMTPVNFTAELTVGLGLSF